MQFKPKKKGVSRILHRVKATYHNIAKRIIIRNFVLRLRLCNIRGENFPGGQLSVSYSRRFEISTIWNEREQSDAGRVPIIEDRQTRLAIRYLGDSFELAIKFSNSRC